ncbi:MAG: hypothetical protein DRG30_07035 [Epsilonproteobacteria bacterium]|nr:MAG: hypothetical protein DRG30_07035 [Campylobacterota bacterium]
MGYNSAAGREEITAVAGQTEFDFVFKIYNDENLIVWKTLSGQVPDANADLLVLHADYEATVNGDDGGKMTLGVAAAAGDSITIVRSLEPVRDIAYKTNGELRPEVLNADQDYQTYLISDQATAFDKVVRLPENSQGVSGELPPPVSEAYIKWNAAGNALENDDTLPQAVIDAREQAWKSQAEYLTAKSYAVEPEDVVVKIWTSNNDGTFTATDTTDYSSFHWERKASDANVPSPSFPTDEGLALVAHATGNDWEKILGLPLETGHLGKSVTTNGVEADSFWSFVNTNPIAMNADQIMTAGTSASVVDGFTINDNITLTVPDGSVLSVV